VDDFLTAGYSTNIEASLSFDATGGFLVTLGILNGTSTQIGFTDFVLLYFILAVQKRSVLVIEFALVILQTFDSQCANTGVRRLVFALASVGMIASFFRFDFFPGTSNLIVKRISVENQKAKVFWGTFFFETDMVNRRLNIDFWFYNQRIHNCINHGLFSGFIPGFFSVSVPFYLLIHSDCQVFIEAAALLILAFFFLEANDVGIPSFVWSFIFSANNCLADFQVVKSVF